MKNNSNLFWDDNGYPILAVVACDPDLDKELMSELAKSVSDCLAKAGLKVQGVSKETLAVTGGKAVA